MSLTQINDYGIGNVNLTSMMEALDRQRRGYQAMSLTNYDNDNEPKIAAGSIVEVGGALFKTEADEAATGWGGIAISTNVYIKLVPSGNTAIAVFTIVAPTWSTSKQGWYVGNDRYIGGLYKDAGGDYVIKWLYAPEDTQNLLREGETRPLLEKVLEIGDWDMDNVGFVDVAHGTDFNPKSIVGCTVIVKSNADDHRLDLMSVISGSLGGAIDTLVMPGVIRLYRDTAGLFDDTPFGGTGNRGWIYLKYRA